MEEKYISEDLRMRLMKFHQEELEVAIQNKDFPHSIDEETARDLAEFLSVFLCD